MVLSSETFTQSKITGTKIAYLIVCARKFWLFSNHIAMEKFSDLVDIGRLVSETSFERETDKEVLLCDTLKIDFLRIGDEVIVHEVKKSRKLEEAHIWQVKFYIYSLRKLGINCSSGVIHYPKLLRKFEVKFSNWDTERVEALIRKGREILQGEIPKVINAPYCRKCAYYSFCYV